LEGDKKIMTNQVHEMQKELLLVALEIQEIEFKMEELCKDYGRNEGMLYFFDKVLNKKTMMFLDLKIKIEKAQSHPTYRNDIGKENGDNIVSLFRDKE